MEWSWAGSAKDKPGKMSVSLCDEIVEIGFNDFKEAARFALLLSSEVRKARRGGLLEAAAKFENIAAGIRNG